MKTKVFNQTRFVGRRRALRSNLTAAEQRLWKQLKGKRLGGIKFRRQYGVGPYVVDFYCPTLKLAIELDGDVHSEALYGENDSKRQEAIEKSGAKVVRYPNSEVLNNINSVLEHLFQTVQSLKARRSPAVGGPPPSQGGGGGAV